MNSISIIRNLATAFGAPGFEDDVIKKAISDIPAGYSYEKDSLLNLYMFKNSPKFEHPKPTLLIDAHSDEVALMVHYIKKNGTIAFTALGQWPLSVLPAQKVLIRNLDGDFITGVIACRPPHFGGDDGELVMSKMIIDVGASSLEEVRDYYKIAPACPIVPQSEFEYFSDDGVMMSKAFDCRLGCAAVLEVLDAVKDVNLGVNLVGSLSSQEEIGMRGAKVVANKVKPDICIAFEGTPADDTFADPDAIQTRLRGGPMLRHIDEGMITNPRFMRFALEIAKKHNITHQEAVRLGGATNGASFHLANEGVPTIIIGHPVRYAHSHNSIAILDDYKKGVQLAVEITKALNADIIKQF